MNTTLTLLDLRDLLTDWEATPTLNAAKHHEARQLYTSSDDIFAKRIVPADFARRLASDDPDGQVFFIQFKSIPATLMEAEDFRRWTPTAEYAVIWPAADWPKSTESRLQRVAHLTATSLEHFARQHESDRLSRMATKIVKRLPALRNLLDILRANATDEDSIRSTIAVFEKALNETIYEPPLERPERNDAHPHGGDSVSTEAGAPEVAAQSPGRAPGTERSTEAAQGGHAEVGPPDFNGV